MILSWGDIALNLPVAEMFRQHIDTGADITLLCTPSLLGVPHQTEYVSLDDEGRVRDLTIHIPVSYTHLDVYKRQPPEHIAGRKPPETWSHTAAVPVGIIPDYPPW